MQWVPKAGNLDKALHFCLPPFRSDPFHTMFASELFGSFKDRAAAHHGRWPGICKIPLPVIGIISLVALVNIVVWIAVGAVLVRMSNNNDLQSNADYDTSIIMCMPWLSAPSMVLLRG